MSEAKPREKKAAAANANAAAAAAATAQHRVKQMNRRTPSMIASNADLSQITPEEWEGLLAGEKYSCQLMVGATDTRDVVLNVNLAGIRLLDPKNEDLLNQFDIEQILQYSYSQQNSTFSFSYLEEGRFFVTHKFLTQDFFEIHQYLGNAIAIVIKLKTQIKKSGPNEVLSQIDTARADKKETKPEAAASLKREGSTRSQRSVDQEAESSKSPSSEVSEEERKSSEISEGTINKSSQAKTYFEDRYKNSASKDKIKDGRRTIRGPPPEFQDGEEGDDMRSSDSRAAEEKAKSMKNTASMTGSMRLRAFSLPEVVSQFDFKLNKNKSTRKNLQDLGMYKNNTFIEINPDALPQTITRSDEEGKQVLIRTMQDGKYQITAGTPEALVESLADNNQPDSLYIDVFLQTYRNFMSPPELLQRLKYRFALTTMRVVKEENQMTGEADANKKPEFIDLDPEAIQLVKLRIASVVKKWVERHWYDFEGKEMAEELSTFIEDMKKLKLEGIALQINKTMQGHKEEAEKRAKNPPVLIENKPYHGIDIHEVTHKDIAHHLTLVSVEILKAIVPDEYVFYIWGKKHPNAARLTQNLQKLIDRFNKIGFWVATEICATVDVKKRTALLEKFIGVAKHLHKIQNFNDVIAVMSGLQTIPVRRLKKTWAAVSQRSMTTYKELETKMGPEGNYKLYRQVEAEAKPPFIPFFALYMKDLTFMNDGNQTYLANGMVNLEKHRTIMNAVLSIRSSQSSLYKYDINPQLLKYCEVIYNKEEEELIEEANSLEPQLRTRRASLASVGSEVSNSTDVIEETIAESAEGN